MSIIDGGRNSKTKRLVIRKEFNFVCNAVRNLQILRKDGQMKTKFCSRVHDAVKTGMIGTMLQYRKGHF